MEKLANEKNMKDENVLKGIIRDLSKITGKSVSLEKEQKIIDTIKNDKVISKQSVELIFLIC